MLAADTDLEQGVCLPAVLHCHADKLPDSFTVEHLNRGTNVQSLVYSTVETLS